ncbi:MAG: phage major capsid protein [Chthoniobacterales bacterium]
MTRQIGLVEQINYLLQRGVPAPDNRIGSQQQQRIARENADAGLMEFEPIGASMHVPISALTNRDLSVASSGGAVVQTDIKSEIEAFLQPYSAVIRLGATVLNGLKGNSQVPIGRAGVTTQWGSETQAATESDPTVGSISLTPHLVSANIVVSRSLLVQSVGVESWLKNELALALATALDYAALLGNGSSGQPTGILSATGTQPVTFGAAANWSKIISFETLAGIANARKENLAWVVGNNTRAKLKQAVKTGTGAVGFIMESDDSINGYPAATTSKLDTTNQVVFGDFQEAFLGFWGADSIHLVVDGITQAKTSKVVLTANLHADVSLRRSNLFIVSTDSGAQ